MKTVIIAFILALGAAAGVYFSASANEIERAFFMGFGTFFGAIEIKLIEYFGDN